MTRASIFRFRRSLIGLLDGAIVGLGALAPGILHPLRAVILELGSRREALGAGIPLPLRYLSDCTPGLVFGTWAVCGGLLGAMFVLERQYMSRGASVGTPVAVRFALALFMVSFGIAMLGAMYLIFWLLVP